MFVSPTNFTAVCPVPEEWNGANVLQHTPLAGRDAFVPAPPHIGFTSAFVAPRTETDRCLHRSYVLVEKLRLAVSL